MTSQSLQFRHHCH